MLKIKRPKSFSDFLYKTAINFAMILIAFYSVKWLGMPLVDRSMVSSAKQGNIENVKFKLDYLYADVNARDKMGYAAIHHAADKGNTNLVRVLLDHGANVNRETKNGKVALEFALKNKQSKMIDLIFAKGINEKTATKALQFLAIEKFYYRPEIPHRSRIPYDEQIKVTLGKKFIKLGADVNKTMHPAVGHDELALTKLLIEHGADVNYKDQTDENKCPMFRVHSAAMVNYLAAQGGNVNCKDEKKLTPLFTASSKDALIALLQNKADINATSLYGSTAITVNKKNILTLLKYGANLHIKSASNKTLLHYAADEETCFELIQHGIDVDVKDDDWITPLHEAIMAHKFDVVNCLLKEGANPNAQTKRGWTPLHYALNDKKIIELLFRYGVKKDIVNAKGQTAYMLYKSTGNKDPEIVALIKNNKGDY